ncbi:MAG: hypothetical protein AB7O45_05675 [Alphaproteobacteria bacterium]
MSVTTVQPQSVSDVRTDGCPDCAGAMTLFRREPHPVLGLPVELRSYRCAACGAEAADTVADRRD